jgi:NTE family protein
MKRPSAKSSPKKSINLALQGGGAHGAFSWGVIDKLLEDGRLNIEGISGTSAGSMNAVVFAYGRRIGGTDGARERLASFWKAVSDAGQRYSPVRPSPWDKFFFGDEDFSPAFEIFKRTVDNFSPYQLNPANWNPLLDVLQSEVDFDVLNSCKETKLFLSATNVRTGKVRVFNTQEITAKSVMASAALPQLFQAVEIDSEHYWDGGYMGNPSLFPLFYETSTGDVLIVHINPIERPNIPKSPTEIYDRVNEVTFNASLIKELRAVAFVQKLLDEGWIKDQYREQLKYVRIHSLRAEKSLGDLGAASKFYSDWKFLQGLRDLGRDEAAAWLDKNFHDIGKRSTVDLRAEFLTSGTEQAPLRKAQNGRKQSAPQTTKRAGTISRAASNASKTKRRT